MDKDLLLAHVADAQEHVLAAVGGLDGAQLARPAAPSGWSVADLLSHLTYDVEVFWAHAILAGEADGIGRIRDGWKAAPADPAEAVATYRAAAARTRELLRGADLDAPPRWWPPADVFPFPAFPTGWHCAMRLLSELHQHAGHLDLAREGIDGRQHLVVG